MEKKLLRTKGNRFCEVSVKLLGGRLSITGTAGRIVKRKAAKSEALASWTEYFKEPGNLVDLNFRCSRNFRSALSAARFVLETDGEFHGLDVLADFEDLNQVLVIESCGQIREEIIEFFPEFASCLSYHLNDLHAECEHQEARGETYTTHPEAICPDCGYKLGSKWLKRELPSNVVEWANAL